MPTNKNITIRLRYWTSEITAALLVLVLLYTGIVKLKDHSGFAGQLQLNPLLSSMSVYLSWGIPVVELVIAVLLILPSTRRTGLLCAGILMSAFTLYITYMLATASKLPCTCGGINSSMSWREHLWFNTTLTVLSLLSYFLNNKDLVAINRRRRTPANIVGN